MKKELKEDDITSVLQWCYNYIRKNKDSDEKKAILIELQKMGCL